MMAMIIFPYGNVRVLSHKHAVRKHFPFILIMTMIAERILQYANKFELTFGISPKNNISLVTYVREVQVYQLSKALALLVVYIERKRNGLHYPQHRQPHQVNVGFNSHVTSSL